MRQSWNIHRKSHVWDTHPWSHVWDSHETFSLSLMYETIMRHSAWVSYMRQSWDIHHKAHVWDNHETSTTQVSQELLVLLVAHSISHILTSVHVFLCVGACMYTCVCAHVRVRIHAYAQRDMNMIMLSFTVIASWILMIWSDQCILQLPMKRIAKEWVC